MRGRGKSRANREPRRTPTPPAAEAAIAPVHGELFERLRRLRKVIADQRNVPAYVVFSDATLLEIAARKPRTAPELLEISGVGPKKLATYGAEFLALLSRNESAAAGSFSSEGVAAPRR